MKETQLPDVALRLRGQQQRFFLFLSERGQCDTIEARVKCSIGNVSECAQELNKKLAAWGESARVVCQRRQHINSYGEKGVIGTWRIVQADSRSQPASM